MNNSTVDFNITNEPYTPIVHRPETYIVPIVFAIIFVIGVVGNGTLILIFSKHRTMRNVPNTYIISLAIGDLVLILTCVPFTSTVYTFEGWPYGLIICKLSEGIKDISVGVSVFTLTALSAERYCAISNPIRRKISSKPFTITIAISIWILATFLAIPSFLFSHIQLATLSNNSTIEYCSPFNNTLPKYRQVITVFKFLVYYLIPLIIIGLFYTLMAKHLLMTTRNMPGELQGQSTQIKARKKVSKMVVAFIILFFICFLPHHIFMLWFHLDPDSEDNFNDFWNTFRMFAFCLSFINSCINPIALYFISGVFRKYFNRYLFMCCRQVPVDNVSTRANSLSCRRFNSVLTHQLTLTNTDNS